MSINPHYKPVDEVRKVTDKTDKRTDNNTSTLEDDASHLLQGNYMTESTVTRPCNILQPTCDDALRVLHTVNSCREASPFRPPPKPPSKPTAAVTGTVTLSLKPQPVKSGSGESLLSTAASVRQTAGYQLPVKKRQCSMRLMKNAQTTTSSIQPTTTSNTTAPRTSRPWSGLRFQRAVTAASLHALRPRQPQQSINPRVNDVSMELRQFNVLMMKRHENLRNIITELKSISNSLDKLQRRIKP
ncbi:hypothetical protein INR49_029163 [Caranx melampygus]|nr:hypothetical protein INR49_029163 [Caranx melampygus]